MTSFHPSIHPFHILYWNEHLADLYFFSTPGGVRGMRRSELNGCYFRSSQFDVHAKRVVATSKAHLNVLGMKHTVKKGRHFSRQKTPQEQETKGTLNPDWKYEPLECQFWVGREKTLRFFTLWQRKILFLRWCFSCEDKKIRCVAELCVKKKVL